LLHVGGAPDLATWVKQGSQAVMKVLSCGIGFQDLEKVWKFQIQPFWYNVSSKFILYR